MCGTGEAAVGRPPWSPSSSRSASPSLTSSPPTDQVAAASAEARHRPSARGTAGTDADAIVAAAEEEGSLTVYSSQVLPVLEELEPAFEEATGLDLEVVRGLPQDLFPKLEAERQTDRGIADIYVIADKQLVANDGVAGHFIAPVGPNFVDSAYDSAAYLEPEGWFLVSSTLFGYGWNTERVPRRNIEDYPDLLDPELKGKIGVPGAGRPVLRRLLPLSGGELRRGLRRGPRRPGAADLPAAPCRWPEALSSGELAAATFVAGLLSSTRRRPAPPSTPAFADQAWGARFSRADPGHGAQPVRRPAPRRLPDHGGRSGDRGPKGRRRSCPTSRGPWRTVDQVSGSRTSSVLTPEFVAEYQQKWNELFR